MGVVGLLEGPTGPRTGPRACPPVDIVIVGKARSGKTMLASCLAGDPVSVEYCPTPGVVCQHVAVRVPEERRLCLWEAGHGAAVREQKNDPYFQFANVFVRRQRPFDAGIVTVAAGDKKGMQEVQDSVARFTSSHSIPEERVVVVVTCANDSDASGISTATLSRNLNVPVLLFTPSQASVLVPSLTRLLCFGKEGAADALNFLRSGK